MTCLAGFLPFGHFVTGDGLSYDIHLDGGEAATSCVVAVLAIALATFMYARSEQPVAAALARRFPKLHRAAYRRFYMDEAWLFVTKRIIFRCVSVPLAWFDRHAIDGGINALGTGTESLSRAVKGMQSGRVQTYAAVFVWSVLVIVVCVFIF